MSVKIEKSRALSTLSLTPLIDVVFLLLIFFLVATKFEEEERSMEVALPQASTAQPLTAKPSEIFVNVDAQGHYFIGTRQLTADGLFAEFQQAFVRNPRTPVIVRADKACSWQHVVQAMDLNRKAGFVQPPRITTAEPDS